ncbi:MAG: hypothetical protein Q9167_004900 [Letrouitia subvulpina]
MSTPAVHNTFTEVKIHTAKCDHCDKHNKETIYRCTRCGRQCCTPCWQRKGGDGTHVLHSADKGWTGLRAAPVHGSSRNDQEEPRSSSGQSRHRNPQRVAFSPATLRTSGRRQTRTPYEQNAENERKRRHSIISDNVSDDEDEVLNEDDFGQEPKAALDTPTKKRRRNTMIQSSERAIGENSRPVLTSQPRRSTMGAAEGLLNATGRRSAKASSLEPGSAGADGHGMSALIRAAEVIETRDPVRRSSSTGMLRGHSSRPAGSSRASGTGTGSPFSIQSELRSAAQRSASTEETRYGNVDPADRALRQTNNMNIQSRAGERGFG